MCGLTTPCGLVNLLKGKMPTTYPGSVTYNLVLKKFNRDMEWNVNHGKMTFGISKRSVAACEETGDQFRGHSEGNVSIWAVRFISDVCLKIGMGNFDITF